MRRCAASLPGAGPAPACALRAAASAPLPPTARTTSFPARAAAGELTRRRGTALERAWRAVLAGTRPRRREALPRAPAHAPGLVPRGDGPRPTRACARAGRGGRARLRRRARAPGPTTCPRWSAAAVGRRARRRTPRRRCALYRRAAGRSTPDDAVPRAGSAEVQAAGDGAAGGRGARGRWPRATRTRAIAEYRGGPGRGAGGGEACAWSWPTCWCSAATARRPPPSWRPDPPEDRQVLAAPGRAPGRAAGVRGAPSRPTGGILARDPRDAEALRRAARGARGARAAPRCPRSTAHPVGAPRSRAPTWPRWSSVQGHARSRRPAAASPRSPSTSRGPGRATTSSEALALDILDVYPNHTFQPAARWCAAATWRAAVARVLDLLRLAGHAPRRAISGHDARATSSTTRPRAWWRRASWT